MKYAWIKQHQHTYPRVTMCCALNVSESGYAHWQSGAQAVHWLNDEQLLVLIRAIHTRVNGAYGSPRITDDIRKQGLPVSKERVRRLMQVHGIRARHKRRYKATTDSGHKLPVADNLLARQFQPTAPDLVWTADITYIPTQEGWLYLAVVMDLYSRMIVGWSMDSRMTKELVLNALRMARFKRQPQPGLIHHSDRGSQYCSHEYQALLASLKIIPSMSRKGNCWDNAPMESWFNSLKNERVFHRSYQTREEAKADLFDYIEIFYNRNRSHSGLKYQTPMQCYTAWMMQQQMAA